MLNIPRTFCCREVPNCKVCIYEYVIDLFLIVLVLHILENGIICSIFFFVQFYVAEVSKWYWLTKQDKIWQLSVCLQRVRSAISIDSERGSNSGDSCCQRSGAAAPASLPHHSLHLLPLYCESGPGLSITELIQLTKLREKVTP